MEYIQTQIVLEMKGGEVCKGKNIIIYKINFMEIVQTNSLFFKSTAGLNRE